MFAKRVRTEAAGCKHSWDDSRDKLQKDFGCPVRQLNKFNFNPPVLVIDLRAFAGLKLQNQQTEGAQRRRERKYLV